MYKRKRLAVVIPAYNEEEQIVEVIRAVPDFVDTIVVVDDGSSDNTSERLETCQAGNNQEVILIRHERNRGCGAARVTGLKWALEHGFDLVALIDGDGQMDPAELPSLIDPIVDGEADYVKGNRFFSGEAWERTPTLRYLANALLSLLTKIASGYWQVADSQSGYAAFRGEALARLDLDNVYPRYGYPNSILVEANIAGLHVRDVPITPIYGVGEKSGMRLWTVGFPIAYMLLRSFIHRMVVKYVIRDFHPLVLFYFAGLVLWVSSCLLLARIVVIRYVRQGAFPSNTLIVLVFCLISSLQFFLFGMWFDMESNKDLR